MTASLRTFNERLALSCPEMSVDDLAIVCASYQVLIDGDDATLHTIAERAGVSFETADSIIAKRPGIARWSVDGHLRGYLGLSLEPSPHTIEIAGRQRWVWCAWDGLFIPVILGTTASLTSACPITRAPISVVVSPHGVVDAQPTTAVMSFIGSVGPAGNGVGACCPFIHFLQSDEAGKRWQASHPTGCVLSLGQAFQLAKTFVDTKLSGTSLLRPCSTC